MKVVGLTGGIGMGKSAVAGVLESFGLPVHSADDAVHKALASGGAAVAPVARAFPEALKEDGSIDRKRLSSIVFSDAAKRRLVENILHPLVEESERRFLQKAREENVRAAVLEIPLLFETGADARCDLTLCVSAPPDLQKARVLKRSGMDEKTFLNILAAQLPDAEKRKKADYVVLTGTSLAETERFLRDLFLRLGLLSA